MLKNSLLFFQLKYIFTPDKAVMIREIFLVTLKISLQIQKFNSFSIKDASLRHNDSIIQIKTEKCFSCNFYCNYKTLGAKKKSQKDARSGVLRLNKNHGEMGKLC